MYKFDLHCHTQGVSKCGKVSPEEGARLYIEAGYSGVVITNHFNRFTFDVLPPNATWEDTVNFFLSGWKRFRDAAGDKLTVLLGMEIRFDQNENDYLVYGITEEFLLTHPEMLDMDVKTFSSFARENGLPFYQAHPFRNGMTVVDPKYLDGVEVYNGHPRHDSRNEIALAWAEKFGLRQISGSDFHDPDGYALGGILTDQPIRCQEDLLRELEKGPKLIRR